MAQFKFQCPHCQQHLEVDQNWIGKTAQCPSCQKSIKINPDLTECKICGTQTYIYAATCTQCGAVTDFCRRIKKFVSIALVLFVVAGILETFHQVQNQKAKKYAQEMEDQEVTAKHLTKLAEIELQNFRARDYQERKKKYEDAKNEEYKAYQAASEARRAVWHAGITWFIASCIATVAGALFLLIYAWHSFYYHWMRF